MNIAALSPLDGRYAGKVTALAARKNELDAVVDLAKALGGGWTSADIKAAEKE